MEFNEYERKLLATLGQDIDEFDVGYLSDYLTNVYWDIDQDVKLQQLMLAVSYVKRLLQKVCDKRNVSYDKNAVLDINSVLENCKSEYEILKDLDVSMAADEKLLSDHLDILISGYDYEQVSSLSIYFDFFYKTFHQYIVDHILPIINNYIDYYYEFKEPEPSDPFLDSIFSSENSSDDQVLDDSWGAEWIGLDFADEAVVLPSTPVKEKKQLTDEEIVELLAFLNSVFDIAKVRSSIAHNSNNLVGKANQKKLEEFHADSKFMERFTAMMEHDKKTHTYRFHGTTCLEDAKFICDQGLGVMRDDLDSTSYRELTMDEIILHQRGFAGEIGRDAYIVIDEPNGVQILESLQEGEKMNIVGSGLQGVDVQANKIVRSKYIIGYVDKRNKEIVFNPEYYDYERFVHYTGKKGI